MTRMIGASRSGVDHFKVCARAALKARQTNMIAPNGVAHNHTHPKQKITAAMSMLTLYIGRAGSILTKARRAKLRAAEAGLRKLFGKSDA